MEAACGAAHRKSEMGAWGFPGVSRYKSRLSQPFLAFCDLLQGLLIFHCSYIFLQAKLAPSAARCDPCSSVVNNGRAHPIHALPLPQCGVGRHTAQARGGERQEAQAAGAPRRLARLGPPSTICPLASPWRRCPQMDRFIPARSAIDLDVAHYNLLKENCGSGAVASPCKARCGPATPLTPSQLPLGSPGVLAACRPTTASGWLRSWARSGPMHASWPSKTRWAHGPPSPSAHGRPGSH